MFTNEVLPLERDAVNPPHSNQYSITVVLYCGSNAFYNNSVLNHFPKSVFADSTDLLKQTLNGNNMLPQIILLDVPFNHLDLVSLKVWLLANGFQNIPLIYNQSCLTTSETKILFRQKLVDDVMDLQQHLPKLDFKLRFLKKIIDSETKKSPTQNLLPSSCRFCFIKRGFDILASLMGIIITLPFMLLIAIIIKFDSKGPIFYFSKRAGKGFKIFNFLKFRTMVLNADTQIQELASLNQYEVQEKGPLFVKLNNDPRITKFGKFLRNSSLDELPQLFNVLKGDMSIVGNRPLPLYEASTLTTSQWAERFMAPAGITGLWQVSKRGQKEMSNEERIRLDIEYARKRNLLYDFKILLKTPGALLQNADV